ncbi:MAG: DUF2024 family protein [Methylotetracoccus sp.]
MAEIHVFDTYATSSSGRIMHFDVILPERDPARAEACAREWLAAIGEGAAELKANACCYCHSEAGAPADMQAEIDRQGYAIYKMEGCPR